MKRAKNSFFQEKQTFTGFMKDVAHYLGIAALFLAVVLGIIAMRPSYANPTDWHDNELSEQIQADARAEARKIWREENGIYQANLTPAAEKELRLYVIKKQAEIDRTWSK